MRLAKQAVNTDRGRARIAPTFKMQVTAASDLKKARMPPSLLELNYRFWIFAQHCKQACPRNQLPGTWSPA